MQNKNNNNKKTNNNNNKKNYQMKLVVLSVITFWKFFLPFSDYEVLVVCIN